MKKEIGIIVGALLVILVGAYFLNRMSTRGAPSGKYTAFAQCVKDNGATFYGAFWCPHCKEQKALFGDAVKLLPYVECSTADGQGQNAVCTAKGVNSYPTWVFADGSRESGTLSMEELAKKTGCTLP
jgi:thiol-disulfide isomerase/thioredoxin